MMRNTQLDMDDRAQSIGIARFFLSLVVGAFVTWIVWEITSPLLDKADQTAEHPDAVEGVTWLSTAVDYLPIMFLGIAFFGLIALSVFQREMLR